MKTSPNTVQQCRSPFVISSILLSTVLSLGAILSSSTVSADSVVDKINITVPISCTLEGTGQNFHNATINNGQYNSAIGETTMKAFCNDNEGFAIYAIGYTDNINGKNVLTSHTLDSTHDIVTGTGISGNTSNWAMKLSTVSDPSPTYPISIENSFDSFHAVPDTYTLVAKRTSGTDIGESAEGSTIQSTYQAYISPTQAAGTYTGQVKYTLIHPHDEPAPPDSMLDIGATVNSKMKNISAGKDNATSNTSDHLIKSIKTANSLPANFEATEANTVSTPDSKDPIYIFFNNENDAGIMYFYTESDVITMNPDSSRLFRRLSALSDISELANWDASNVTSLYTAFSQTTSLTSVSALSGWDTSSVTNLEMVFLADTGLTSLDGLNNWNVSNATSLLGLFYGCTGITDISALIDWNVGNVQNMTQTFEGLSSLTSLHGLDNWDTHSLRSLRGAFRSDSALTDISALSSWNTSNVTDIGGAFASDISIISALALNNWDTSSVTKMDRVFQYDTALTTIDLSNWDTSSVTDMNRMFGVGTSLTGNGQLQEIRGIEDWNTSNVVDMTGMFYGAGQMTYYDIANWDVSKVESFNHMFTDNFKLESLDLSRWNVSSVKTMYNMFDDDRALTTIGDVSHWNTASLIDVGGWLNGATSFVGNNGTLDLSGWNTGNLKVAGEAFRATKLQTIDLSGWDFGSITNDMWECTGTGIYYATGNQEASYKALGGMFLNIPTLTNVYISQSGLDSFNTAVNNGVNTTNMWSGSGASGFTVKP